MDDAEETGGSYVVFVENITESRSFSRHVRQSSTRGPRSSYVTMSLSRRKYSRFKMPGSERYVYTRARGKAANSRRFRDAGYAAVLCTYLGMYIAIMLPTSSVRFWGCTMYTSASLSRVGLTMWRRPVLAIDDEVTDT